MHQLDLYILTQNMLLNQKDKEVHDCLVARILDSHFYGLGSIPGQGTEILKAMYSQKKKKQKTQKGN